MFWRLGVAGSGGRAEGKVIFEETFSDGKMDGWWVEGGQKVWVEDGRLHMKADPAENRAPGYVCTAWCEKEFPADVMVEYDAHVVESAIDTNNINFFLSYSHPRRARRFTIPARNAPTRATRSITA